MVDDDHELIELLRFVLKKSGFTVAVASDGIDALKKSRTLIPDLVVLDLLLPELDGFTVCEILRQDPITSSARIIMLTALPGELTRVTGLAAGADEFFSKPFSPKQLISRIEALLGS